MRNSRGRSRSARARKWWCCSRAAAGSRRGAKPSSRFPPTACAAERALRSRSASAQNARRASSASSKRSTPRRTRESSRGSSVAPPKSRTVPDLIDELAARLPEREALIGSGRRYTYRELRDEVRRLARGLHALGVRRGDKVAILMGNRPEWLIADFAITLLGAVMVAVNTWATARELQHILSHSDTRFLFCVARFLKHDYTAVLPELD